MTINSTTYYLLWSLLFSLSAFSQSIINGKVSDSYGPISGATIYIKGTSIGTQTNIEGHYNLNITDGDHTLAVSYVGYATQEKKVTVKKNEALTLNFTLELETTSLSNVKVYAKTEADKIKEQAFEVEVIETKVLKNSSINAINILQKIPGVNIRQSGGLGSSSVFSLNGLSGKKVRIFIDGISIDNYGSSVNLNNFPPSLIERVEIYKGATPIFLGADALGGAINIVANQSNNNLIDASYSYGSFNTHQAALNIQQNFGKNWILKLSSYYNSSDNNYKIDDIQLFENFNATEIVDNVERFHDAYESQMIDVKAGVVNKSYADELLIGISASADKNELQHSEVSTLTPYGQAETRSNSEKVALFYKKNDLFKNKINLKLNATLARATEKQIDTSSLQFDWLGNSEIRRSGGNQLGGQGFDKTLFTFNDELHSLNFSSEYKVFKNLNVSFNYTKDYIKRTGEDPFRAQLVSPFEDPHILDKNILGLSFNLTKFEKKWNTNLFVKQFFSNLEGVIEDPFAATQTNFVSNSSNTGYGLASTFVVNNNLRIKASFEKGFRIADGEEFFGDGLRINSNIELEPEESLNYNFGVLYGPNIGNVKLNFDANIFHRNASNFIIGQSQAIFLKYFNIAKVKITGLETEIKANYKDKFLIGVNATYQELIDVNLDNSRLANRPYLFGNANANYSLNNALRTDDKISVLWNTYFVEEFPFTSFTLGNEEDRPVVAQQLTHNLELIYSLKNGKYNISFLTKNITDAKVFDNFSIQQPGRAFYLKARYNLN